MHMTEQHIKEQLSKAYANAVAANAGIIFRDYGSVDYGVDGKFSDVDVFLDEEGKCRYSENGYGIECQIKASINVKITSEKILYNLEVKNYKDLIRENVGTQRILILFSLPKERKEWLKINEDSAILQRCAWWCSLRGKPATKNKKTIQIEISEKQLLTSDELKRIMQFVKEGGFL